MSQDKKDLMVLPFADPRKRGLIRLVSMMFWVAAPVDSIVLSSLAVVVSTIGAFAELFAGRFSSSGQWVVIAAVAGGLAYYQYKLLQRGTSPFKKLFGMQVLKYDPELKSYRRCTAKEYVIRDVFAMVYLPVPTIVLSIPMIVGGAMAGGLTHAMNGDDGGDERIRHLNEQRANAAAMAGAAAGAALSHKMIQAFPWLLAAHDSVLKTMVVNVNSSQAKYFEEGGLFETNEPVKPYAQAA